MHVLTKVDDIVNVHTRLSVTAFDLELESPQTRDLYGRNAWGQGALLCRRLVEAGATFVTLNTDSFSGQWDNHGNLPSQYREMLPVYDQMLTALVDDLVDRGLYERVLVLVWGEFGRTPKVNAAAGRDHWGPAACALLGGGGLRGGVVVGSTTRYAVNLSGRLVPTCKRIRRPKLKAPDLTKRQLQLLAYRRSHSQSASVRRLCHRWRDRSNTARSSMISQARRQSASCVSFISRSGQLRSSRRMITSASVSMRGNCSGDGFDSETNRKEGECAFVATPLLRNPQTNVMIGHRLALATFFR